jgi:hypothetical protein
MPHPNELAQEFAHITAEWTYIRWRGDRKGIEQITKVWDKVVVDRTNLLSGWVGYFYQVQKRRVVILHTRTPGTLTRRWLAEGYLLPPGLFQRVGHSSLNKRYE